MSISSCIQKEYFKKTTCPKLLFLLEAELNKYFMLDLKQIVAV